MQTDYAASVPHTVDMREHRLAEWSCTWSVCRMCKGYV